MKISCLIAILVLIPGSAACQTINGKDPHSVALIGIARLTLGRVNHSHTISIAHDGSTCPASALPICQKGDAPESRIASSDDASSLKGDGQNQLSSPKRDLSYLAYYAYAELPPDEKPADLVLATIKDVPVGTPLQEIKRAADAFGIDFHFMQTVAKIESDFDPKQRTGSYIGLFQLSRHEFQKYGSGEITSARDNAIAAANKFAMESVLFELDTHRNPTFSELYLIHQQGWEGASEHASHPERIAWQSMCATDEGREKGQAWCKLAIWGNTPASVKHVWGSVDNLTSAGFVSYWAKRVDELYQRYSRLDMEIPTTGTTEVAADRRSRHAARAIKRVGPKRAKFAQRPGQRPRVGVHSIVEILSARQKPHRTSGKVVSR